MRLFDVNVLVNAYRPEADRHHEYRAWVDAVVNGEEAYSVSDFVVNGFIRIVTNKRLYRAAASTDSALGFANTIRNQPHAMVVHPGGRHWEIFARLCRETGAVAKLVPDAYLAALAIEHGCEFVTCDKDFGQFQGLRWRHPLN